MKNSEYLKVKVLKHPIRFTAMTIEAFSLLKA